MAFLSQPEPFIWQDNWESMIRKLGLVETYDLAVFLTPSVISEFFGVMKPI